MSFAPHIASWSFRSPDDRGGPIIFYKYDGYPIKEILYDKEDKKKNSFYFGYEWESLDEPLLAKLTIHFIDQDRIRCEFDYNDKKYPSTRVFERVFPQKDDILWRMDERYTGDNIIVNTFFTSLELKQLKPMNKYDGWEGYFIPEDEGSPYSRVSLFNFPDLPLYLRYYDNVNPQMDNDTSPVFAIGASRLLSGTLIPHGGEYAYIVPIELFIDDYMLPSFWLLEHEGKKYVCAVCPVQRDYTLAPYMIAIFDITDTGNIKAAMFETLAFYQYPEDTKLEVGIYGGKLCLVKTEWVTERAAYRSALYALEEDGLVELLDIEGEPVELFFVWDKQAAQPDILEEHIPAGSVISEYNPQIKPKIIPFETGMRDWFQEKDINGESLPEGKKPDAIKEIDLDLSKTNEAEIMVTEQKSTGRKYELFLVIGIIVVSITGAIRVKVLSRKL